MGRARRELNGVVAEMRRVQQMLMTRQASWDTDELAQHWAQAAAALHAKDRSMAALLARRRTARQKVVKLLQYLPEALAALPERERVLEGWRQQCDTLRAHLLHSSLLIAEEVAVADAIAALAFIASSGLGPRADTGELERELASTGRRSRATTPNRRATTPVRPRSAHGSAADWSES